MECPQLSTEVVSEATARTDTDTLFHAIHVHLKFDVEWTKEKCCRVERTKVADTLPFAILRGVGMGGDGVSKHPSPSAEV